MSSSLMQPHEDREEHLMMRTMSADPQQHAEDEGMESPRQPLTLEKKGSFAEMVVKAASGLNRLVLENCSICTLYCDKQVQYESAVMERFVTGSSTLWSSPEVEEYKTQLFDEKSVVESVHSRCED